MKRTKKKTRKEKAAHRLVKKCPDFQQGKCKQNPCPLVLQGISAPGLCPLAAAVRTLALPGAAWRYLARLAPPG